jgi:Domain of unknown function (DUF4349)
MHTIRPTTTPIRAIALATLVLVAAACAGSASMERPAPAGDQAGIVDQGRSSSDGGGPTAAPGDGVGAPVDDARIVRTGAIDLEVTDVDAALDAARAGIRALGGYIGASRTQHVDDRPTASVTYRVPTDRWEEALALLRRLDGLTSRVVDERTDAVEVTAAIVDLEARIRNLRASEAALQEIAARATRIGDVLEVQAQLTTVRGQIEQLGAQLTDLGDRADLATLTATFRVPVVAVEAAAERWEPATVVDEATASLVTVLQALTTAAIWFVIVWLPVLLLVGLVGVATLVIGRRLGVVGRVRGRGVPTPG